MALKQINLSISLVLLLFVPGLQLLGVGQDVKPASNAAKAYENRQRALKLSFLKNPIKNLEDAPMRCFLNIAILKFIVDNKVVDQMDVAESAAVSCLEDIEKNPLEFGAKGLNEKSTILQLLRNGSPEFAKEVQRKYLDDIVSKATDLEEVGSDKDLPGLMGRELKRISQGDVADAPFFFDQIKRRDTTQSFQILRALLAYFETTPDLSTSVGTLRQINLYYSELGVPNDLRVQFYRFIIKLGETQLSQPTITPLYEVVSLILETSIIYIQTTIPALFESSRGLSIALKSRITAKDEQYDEARKRINESEDKLAQTIAEAEAATDKTLKNTFWFEAAAMAIREKKFRLAVDCRMNYEETKGSEFAKDYFLLNDVIVGALRAKDFTNADYAAGKIVKPIYKADAEVKIASKYAELGNSVIAFERIQASIKILDKVDKTNDTVRIMLSTIPVAFKIDKTTAFDIASQAIVAANHLDLPGSDQKMGSPERVKYSNGPLLWNAYNLSSAFRTLSTANFAQASAIAEEVRSRSWRLAIEVVLETERVYPMPLAPSVRN